MNANTFRLVFSKRLGMLVPVAEQTSSHVKGGASGEGPKHGHQGGASFLFKSIAFSVALAFSAPGFTLPTDPTVVNGTATFNQVGNVLTVTNSNKAIIDWQKFGIAAGETTHFLQGSASSSVLNRVLTNNPSQIYGTLSSNGRVWLINQAGIMVGPGANIDTAGFVGSTLNVRAEDFLAGRMNFQATPGAGSVVNQGSITTPAGGSVYLVGPSVSNEGIINAPNGEVILAAGATVNLIDTATPGVKVEITGADNNATNLGSIVAEAGRIGIAGAIVRNSGTLDASSVTSEGGRIFLKASQDTYVDGNGRIVATGTKGGQVEVLGNRVAVMDNASIDASGANGGGTILVGGDYQGKNPDIQNATITFFGQDATLKANATDNGNGGKVIVWADDITRAFGSIEAKGGPNGGNGGFVETSGKGYLDFHASVDTSAAKGKAGTLLLDPSDIQITSAYGAEDYYGGSFSGGVFSGSASSMTVIDWGTIDDQLVNNHVVITTSGTGGNGDIFIADSHTYFSDNDLRLLAHRHITSNEYNVENTGTGGMMLVAGWNQSSGTTNPTTTGTTGSIIGGGHFTTNGGAFVAKAAGSIELGYISTVSSDYGKPGGGVTMVAGSSIQVYGIDASGSDGDYDYDYRHGGAGGTIKLTAGTSIDVNYLYGYGGDGGEGRVGGIGSTVDLKAGTYISVGSIYVDGGYGGYGYYSPPGKGGKGGTILMDAGTYIDTGSLSANGGNGGYGYSYYGYAGADGGNGGSIVLKAGTTIDAGYISASGGHGSEAGYGYGDHGGKGGNGGYISVLAGGNISIAGAYANGGDGDDGGENYDYYGIGGNGGAGGKGGTIILGSSLGSVTVSNGVHADGGDGAAGDGGEGGYGANAAGGAGGTIIIGAKTDIGISGSGISADGGESGFGYYATGGTGGAGGKIMIGVLTGDLNVNGDIRADGGEGMSSGGVGGNVTIGLGSSTARINSIEGISVMGGYSYWPETYAANGLATIAKAAGELEIGDIGSVDGNLLLVAPTINNSGFVSAYGTVTMVANDYVSYGGTVSAYWDIDGVVANNMILESGATLSAGNEVNLSFANATSSISLNGNSRVYAGSPSTIYLNFLGRTSGGVIIDGVETTKTVDGSSGFYDAGYPAVLGSGLIISYFGLPLVIKEIIKPIDPCLLTPEACQINLGGLADLARVSDQSTGGGEGEFGEGENKGKGKKSGMCKG